MYKTLKELKDAYASGAIPSDAYLVLDNDTASVYIPKGPEDDPYADSECVFEMHPETILVRALDLLSIPWDHV